MRIGRGIATLWNDKAAFAAAEREMIDLDGISDEGIPEPLVPLRRQIAIEREIDVEAELLELPDMQLFP